VKYPACASQITRHGGTSNSCSRQIQWQVNLYSVPCQILAAKSRGGRLHLNEYLYLQVPAVKVTEPAEVRVSFEVTRHEHRVMLEAHPVTVQSGPTSPSLQRFLQSDRRVPPQGVIAELAARQTNGIREPLAKAHAIYNYVISTMRYDKSGTGWGNGDAI
jgi:transglutaminase-like putative cysteine protease